MQSYLLDRLTQYEVPLWQQIAHFLLLLQTLRMPTRKRFEIRTRLRFAHSR